LHSFSYFPLGRVECGVTEWTKLAACNHAIGDHFEWEREQEWEKEWKEWREWREWREWEGVHPILMAEKAESVLQQQQLRSSAAC
jgi:hypothetical protein